jgi:hypothetical protein
MTLPVAQVSADDLKVYNISGYEMLRLASSEIQEITFSEDSMLIKKYDGTAVPCSFDEIQFFTFMDFIVTKTEFSVNDNTVVYPNPAKNELSISSPEIIKEISLFSITGKKVMYIPANSQETKMSLNNIRQGVYFLHIKTDNSEFIKKIVKSN